MEGQYLPRIDDFFPNTRRGHGSMHPIERTSKDGIITRNGCLCVNDACSLLRRQDHSGKTVKGELHDDKQANVKDWKGEHGFNEHTPLELCHSRELAR